MDSSQNVTVKSLLYNLIYIFGLEFDEDADETLRFEVQQKKFKY